MDYQLALQLARANPGSTVTRSDDGFIVRRPDGSLLSPPDPDLSEMDRLRSERDYWKQRYDDALSLVDEARHEGRMRLAKAEAEIQELRAQLLTAQRDCTELHSSIKEQRRFAEDLANKLEQARARAAKVRPEEWKRIKAEEEAERQQYAAEMRAKRLTQQCPCLGEVENCARCNGKGCYVTDGFGNIVSA